MTEVSPVLKRLRALRDKQRTHRMYTVSWLAATIEMDRSLLYKCLRGQRSMDPYRRVQIAQLLEMNPDDIVPPPLADEEAA